MTLGYRFILIIALAGTLSSGCRSQRAATKASHSADCGSPIRGAADILHEGSIVLVGELHGTNEIEDAVGDLACTAVTQGRSVRVGFEHEKEYQETFERYLASSGSIEDREKLLATPIWQTEFPDGRSSVAIVRLLERLRRFRRAGHDVASFLLLDSPTRDGARAWAEAVTTVRAQNPNAILLVIAGNAHTRLDSTGEMGGVLHQQIPTPPLVSLAVAYEGGTYWGCPVPCGVRSEKGMDSAGTGRSIQLMSGLHTSGSNAEAWHGLLHVGPITASPPGRLLNKETPLLPQ